MRTVKVIAPAKVNLYLGIGAKRPDGYHDVTTAMHALALHDVLQMTLVEAGERVLLAEPGDAAQPLRELVIEPSPGEGLQVSAHMVWTAGLVPAEVNDESNLACRAVRELAAVLGRNCDEHLRIVVEKSIPHQTGLGGGSSDAAAALVGAAELWGIDSRGHEVLQAALAVGVDMAFFLYGGCALLEGRGDVFVHTLEPRRDSLVIVKPAGGVSTAQAYGAFDEAPQPVSGELTERLYKARTAHEVPLVNNLAPASEQLHAQLASVREFSLSRPGVSEVLLCGSGAGTFAICQDYASAQALAAAAQQQGWWVRATSFAPIGAALLPS